MSTTWQAIVGFSAMVGGSLMLALTLAAVLMIIDSVWEWLLSHIKLHKGWYCLGYRHAKVGRASLFQDDEGNDERKG